MGQNDAHQPHLDKENIQNLKTKIKRQVKEKDTRKVMTRETSNEKNSREG